MAVDSLQSNMSEFLVLATKKKFRTLLNILIIFSVPHSKFFLKSHAILSFYFIFRFGERNIMTPKF